MYTTSCVHTFSVRRVVHITYEKNVEERKKKKNSSRGEHGPVARSDRLPDWFCAFDRGSTARMRNRYAENENVAYRLPLAMLPFFKMLRRGKYDGWLYISCLH
jgi:hypothetical protein